MLGSLSHTGGKASAAQAPQQPERIADSHGELQHKETDLKN